MKRAAWILGVATWPGAKRAGASPVSQVSQKATESAASDRHPISDVTNRLSAYMSEAGDRALPDKVLEQAKWHILDTVAAMVSGSELTTGRAAIDFAQRLRRGEGLRPLSRTRRSVVRSRRRW